MESPSSAPVPREPQPRESGHQQLNGAFLVTAEGCGPLSREATRTSRFTSPSRGVRIEAAIDDQPLARRSAALLGSGPDGVLADLSAAQAWGLPLPPWIGLHEPERPICVAVAKGNQPRRGDVRGRRLRLPPDHATEHAGLRLTTPARTWLDCAPLIPLAHLVAMGDALLARQLASRVELETVTGWATRRRGVINARRALPVLDGRSASPGESLVRAHLVLAGLPAPVCNLDIVEDGEWLARVDLAWREARLIVEYDGVVHLPEGQRRSDAARRNRLQAAGWQVITLTAADLHKPWLMIALVQSTLKARQQPR